MLVAILLASCGAQQDSGQKIAGESLTVFSSMPLDGPMSAEAEQIVRGQKLALAQAKGKAGKFTINYISLNDADREGWDSRLAAEDARKAAREGKAISYIGELNSSGSAIALPILNEGDILQVSPTSTAVGLTKVFPGAKAGEPDRYYPSGRRNFVRLIATDTQVANAAARWAKRLKAKNVLAMHDGTAYGKGLANQFGTMSRRLGLRVAAVRKADLGPGAFRQASTVGKSEADLVFFGGEQTGSVARYFKAIHAASSTKKLIASSSQDGKLGRDFYGKLGEASSRTRMVAALLDSEQLGSRGRRFLRDYRAKFKQQPGRYAVYGYASMQFTIGVLKRAGESANDRIRVIEEAFDTSDYRSVLGKLSIDENGDSSIGKVAGYEVSGGEPVFRASLKG